MTIAVKCPDCNREVKTGEPCPECRKKVPASEGVKVEYKDFKGAELLDIQMPWNRPPVQPQEQPAPAQMKTMRSGPDVHTRKKNPLSKNLLILTAVVLAALACFLLLKFFFWQ